MASCEIFLSKIFVSDCSITNEVCKPVKSAIKLPPAKKRLKRDIMEEIDEVHLQVLKQEKEKLTMEMENLRLAKEKLLLEIEEIQLRKAKLHEI